jgi:hypothetical protein
MKLEDTQGIKALQQLEEQIPIGAIAEEKTLYLLNAQVTALFQIAAQLELLRAELRGEK